jgi:hypothetical protein
MLKGNQLKFQRGAAAKTEGEDRNNGVTMLRRYGWPAKISSVS